MQQGSKTPQPEPGGKGERSTVVVTASKNASGNWNFRMAQDGRPTEALHFSKDEKKMKKVDWHDVVFVLKDPSGTLAFHPDKDQALWVARGDEHNAPPCPAKQSSDPCKGFRVKSNPRPNELLVHNDNAKECLLSYRLNFVAAGSGSNTIVAYHDPVVGNKNGGG